jgi:SAM-dependent methyltransferase
MDQALFRRLLAPDGQHLLAEVERLDLSEAARLRTLATLRKLADAELAMTALETAILRQRAAAKFSRAGTMYFTREALEQATSETVARHRSARFAGAERVVDLGCGIGGDTLALAGVTGVVGVERDATRLRMARENVRAYGVAGRVAWVQGDIMDGGPVRAGAAFVDPSRRTAGGKRVFSGAGYDPPLGAVLGWAGRFASLAVKVAPGIADAELTGFNGEVEFVSLAGELKEAVLWLGAVAGRGRRATLLPGGDTLHAAADPPAPLALAGQVLYEPDPAVIRAHLLGTLAGMLDAWQIDPTIAYLSADEHRPTPFARAWAVEAVLPFGVDRVRRHLRALGVGRVTVKKRGSPLDTDALARQLSGRGRAQLGVVLTRVRGKPAALLCAPPADATSGDGSTRAR